jgi:hypothetical protein
MVRGSSGLPVSSFRGISGTLEVRAVTVCALSLFGFVLLCNAEGWEAWVLPFRVRDRAEELFRDEGRPLVTGGGDEGTAASGGDATPPPPGPRFMGDMGEVIGMGPVLFRSTGPGDPSCAE